MIHDMIMAAAGAGGAAGPTDADFENTVLLLHGDGTNGAQNNTFIDSSTNAFTITRNGNTTQGTFSPFSKPDGRWGNFFDGNGDNLTTASNSAFDFGTGSFTLECWFNKQGAGGSSDGVGNVLVYTGDGSNNAVWLGITDSGTIIGKIGFNGSSWASEISGGSVGNGSWNHVALVRNGSAVDLYLNGTSIANTTNSTNLSTFGTNSAIGVNYGSTRTFNGYISNARINKSAVYTTGFTPSTTPLTAITNTSLLTCQSNRFKDNSSNNFAITAAGNVKVTPFSPFPITTAYSTSVNGGAGYFDGSGDYLTSPSSQSFNLSSGNWTIEGWTYGVALANDNRLFSLEGSSTSYALIRPSANTTSLEWNRVGTGALITSSGGVSPAGSWTHFALVSNSGTITLYVNGVSAGTTATYPDNSATQFTLAATDVRFQTSNTNAYFADIRVVKGTAVYTTGFTPPTAPLTAISNTELLCNFTNAGIFDNTGFNALETVGNAQIDTTTKKYGTGSMEFDGTGDYLITNGGENFAFGTGDFTIEFWLYTNQTANEFAIVDFRTTNGAFPFIAHDSTRGVFYYLNTNYRIESNTVLTTGVWYHIAVARSGSSTKLFIDGTQAGSTFTDSTSLSVGANRPIVGTNGANVGTLPLNGFIDDFRISRIARYTSNFTPPTEALPDIGA